MALFGTMTVPGYWPDEYSFHALRHVLHLHSPAEDGYLHGIFNFFIVIPEIISALSFDWIPGSCFRLELDPVCRFGGLLMFPGGPAMFTRYRIRLTGKILLV